METPVDFDLPNSLQTIKKDCFENIYASEITIPSNTKTIGENAFISGRIKDLDIKGAEKIENNAFDGVTGIEKFSISNVDEIGKYGFYYTDMPEINLYSCNGISMGDYAFGYNKKLTKLTLPDTLGSLGNYIFASCTSLTTVEYNFLSDFKEIPCGMFSGCSSLNEFYSKTQKSVKSNTVYIPSGVETIGESAFSSCNSIENISFNSKLKTISNYAFSGNTGLTEIEIPSGVKTLGDGAFSGCTNLTKITIPENVTSIGKDAFSKCPDLTIYGVTGSYAEKYANDNKIPFVDPNKAPETPVTEATTTEAVVTEATTTEAVVTEATTTEAVVTEATTTEAVVTEATTSEAVVTEATTTEAVVTEATTTEAVVTEATTTEAETTDGSSDVTTEETTGSVLPEILLVGDLNCDGVTDLTDLTILSVQLMNKTLNMEKNPQADIDCNGLIDIADLARLKQFISKDPSVKELGLVKKKD